MHILTKAHVLNVARRVYGPDKAQSLADELPDRIDLDDAADVELLFKLGLTPDGLFNSLGGEL